MQMSPFCTSPISLQCLTLKLLHLTTNSSHLQVEGMPALEAKLLLLEKEKAEIKTELENSKIVVDALSKEISASQGKLYGG